MTTQTSHATAANAFASAFETRKRPDGQAFTCLADNAPRWMRDAVFAAHGGMGGRLPCDYLYLQCRAAAHHAAETLADADADADAAETLQDEAHEFADSAVPIYNVERTAWLADHLDNAAYVDEAADLVTSDAGQFDRIAAGMAVQALETYGTIVAAILDNADDYPAYVAGYNMPGYLPDVEPAEFAEFATAREYIAAELREAADLYAPDEYAPAIERAADEVDNASEPFNITAAGVAYWVVEAE